MKKFLCGGGRERMGKIGLFEGLVWQRCMWWALV
jgi:hypothetical protein